MVALDRVSALLLTSDFVATNTVAQSDHVDTIDALDRGCRWRDSIGFCSHEYS